MTMFAWTMVCLASLAAIYHWYLVYVMIRERKKITPYVGVSLLCCLFASIYGGEDATWWVFLPALLDPATWLIPVILVVGVLAIFGVIKETPAPVTKELSKCGGSPSQSMKIS
jgi:ABC-type antimicrobial peptide transport system permease subunit